MNQLECELLKQCKRLGMVSTRVGPDMLQIDGNARPWLKLVLRCFWPGKLFHEVIKNEFLR